MTSRFDTRESRYGWSDEDWERMQDPAGYDLRKNTKAMLALAAALNRYCDLVESGQAPVDRLPSLPRAKQPQAPKAPVYGHGFD